MTWPGFAVDILSGYLILEWGFNYDGISGSTIVSQGGNPAFQQEWQERCQALKCELSGPSLSILRALSSQLNLMISQKVVTPVKTGVQGVYKLLKLLDSGFRRNDEKRGFRR